jgi:hypothetical protein
VRNSKLQQALKPGETFKARPDHRVLLLIDEFPTLGKMPIFQTAFAYIAGYGIKAYLITQDIEQMKDTYGNHESIISNCHIRIAFAPNKTETAEALSKMAGTATILRAAVSYSGSRTSPLATNVSTNVDHISRPLITVDELMRLPGPIKEGQGEAQRIVAPGAMLIFIAGQPPIFGKQLLYFQDPVLQKRSAIKLTQTLFTIEHEGNILSPGKLYHSDTLKSNRGLIQGPIQVKSATLLDPPSKPPSAAAASSASGGPKHIISSDKQTLTTSQAFTTGDHEMKEQVETAVAISQQPAPTDEMQEIFAQLDEGMEEMDRNFHIYELQRSAGAASNER